MKSSRKLVLTYTPNNELDSQNIEMKFAVQQKFVDNRIPERVFPGAGATYVDPDYTEHIRKICNALNREIEKLVDGAQFQIVEVNIIK